MSRDDPSYVPSSTNPFASIQRFQHGRKLLGTSIDYAAELPSPGNSFFPPSPDNLGQRGGRDGIGTVCVRVCVGVCGCYVCVGVCRGVCVCV